MTAPAPRPGIVRDRGRALGVVAPDHGRQGIRQDGAEPGLPFAFGRTPELGPPLMSVKDRLLDDIGGVYLGAEPGAHLEPNEQQEIVAVILDRPDVVASITSHG